jgi:hypothetical protein
MPYKHRHANHIPQDVAPHKRAIHNLLTGRAKSVIEVHSDGYVTVDGIRIAHVTDEDYIHINPQNWIAATQSMSRTEQGALAELVFSHRPGKTGVAS